MNTVEKTMLKYIEQLEFFMFNNCDTARDREEVRILVDSLTEQLIRIVGLRNIKEMKKNGT